MTESSRRVEELARDAWSLVHSRMWPMTNTTTTNQDASDSSDEDVLRAVLEFVESFDTDDAIAHKTTAAVHHSRSRKRHSSERIKSEIHALRQLAVKLEDRVAHLQYERTSRQVTVDGASVPGCWEIEALRQEEQRLQAEMENLELKRLVEAQAKVTQRLEVLFQRSVQSEGAETTMTNNQRVGMQDN